MVTDPNSPVLLAVTLLVMLAAHAGGYETCRHVTVSATTVPRYITSPGYPYGYGRNISCRWYIHALEGKNIKLEVVMSDLDTRPFTPCKNRDYVEVLDGESTDDALGLFCGQETPTYVSTNNSIVIKFQSTISGEAGKGFRLKFYEGVFAHEVYPTNYLQAGLTAQTFYPFYVSYTDYRFVEMSWRIQSFHKIEKRELYIRTLSSNLMGHTADDNYMEAFDGKNRTSKSLGKWRGSELVEKYASGHHMFIFLHGRYYNKDVKFEIEYGTRIKNSGTSPGVATIAGISIGVIVFLGVAFLIIKILYMRCKDESDEESSTEDTREAAGSLVQNDHPIHQPTPLRVSPSAPPIREEVELSPPPPSYEEVMRTMK